jgi:hypothetical protein
MSFEIGSLQIDEAGRLPGKRKIQRANVEVPKLIGREERELAPPRDDTGEVLR